MSLKSFFDKLREEEKKRHQEEKASLNTDVNVFKNKPANTQSSTLKATAKSGAGTGGTEKVQNNTAKAAVKSTGGGTSSKARNTDLIDSDWGLNAKAYADMTVKLKKTSVNKSTDMIDNEYGFNVKAMDDYLSKMRSGQKSQSNKGAVIYDNAGDKIKDNKYADIMINIGKEFSNFAKYNHLNDLYYINNPNGLDDGYKYINKDDMNKYFYLLAQHEKGDVDKKDVDDLKHYLFRIGEPIDKKDADELPPIEHKPDYSKISSDEQLIYDSFGNVVNKPSEADYSQVQDTDHFLGLAIDDINEYKDIKESNFDKQLRLAIQQLVLGDYDPDEHTKLGTAAQIVSGFLGIDLPMDIRDLVYDITHKDSIPDYKKRILLDIIAFAPVIGDLKYINKASRLGKGITGELNIVDDASDAFKNADEVAQGAGKISIAKTSDLNITQYKTLSNKEYEILLKDIKTNGIKEPIRYVEYNGKKYIVDGHHRMLAAKQLGITNIPIQKVTLPYKGYKTIDDILWYD